MAHIANTGTAKHYGLWRLEGQTRSRNWMSSYRALSRLRVARCNANANECWWVCCTCRTMAGKMKQRTGWSSGNCLDVYYGGSRFVSWTGCWLICCCCYISLFIIVTRFDRATTRQPLWFTRNREYAIPKFPKRRLQQIGLYLRNCII